MYFAAGVILRIFCSASPGVIAAIPSQTEIVERDD